jgi:hypothetical protein
MTEFLPINRVGKSATVPNRKEAGIVLQWGANLGMPPHGVYAVILHFPVSGEVAWYNSDRVTLLD